ncbi:MAG: 5'/3'-nucleotidase SurE [Nitrospirae bacterium]|nr:5'/3'-nucleotidase SurE [Nitrospirota bacterium]
MIILVSNDDGIYSPGIQVLAKALQELGRVYIVAPDRERSGASHALTLHRPLLVEEVRPRMYSVNGTPTDCVNLAINGLLPERPSLVVSGINRGGNMGEDVTYSGTVSAAMEGVLLRVPSFAVSVAGEGDFQFATAAHVALRLAGRILEPRSERGRGEQGLPPGTLLNVNVPNLPLKDLKGIRVTHQGKRHFSKGEVQELVDPRGRRLYWIGGNGLVWEQREGSDFEAVEGGCVSVTPLHLDLTHYAVLGEVETLTKGMKLE